MIASRPADRSRSASPPAEETLDWSGRAGHVAKGVVYVLLGGLTLGASAGLRSLPKGEEDALEAIWELRFGSALLALLLLGLFLYAGWRLVQAARDLGRKGSGSRGLTQRAIQAVSGLSYLGLALWGAAFLWSRVAPGAGAPDASAKGALTEMLPPGLRRFGIALIGGGLIVAGGVQIAHAARGGFLRRLEPGGSRAGRRAARALGAIGIAARGLVFLLIGGTMARTAIARASDRPAGLREALHVLAAQPAGELLLAATGAGLACYGLYCLACARYEQFA